MPKLSKKDKIITAVTEKIGADGITTDEFIKLTRLFIALNGDSNQKRYKDKKKMVATVIEVAHRSVKEQIAKSKLLPEAPSEIDRLRQIEQEQKEQNA
jgi:hypothetical protein